MQSYYYLGADKWIDKHLMSFGYPPEKDYNEVVKNLEMFRHAYKELSAVIPVGR